MNTHDQDKLATALDQLEPGQAMTRKRSFWSFVFQVDADATETEAKRFGAKYDCSYQQDDEQGLGTFTKHRARSDK